MGDDLDRLRDIRAAADVVRRRVRSADGHCLDCDEKQGHVLGCSLGMAHLDDLLTIIAARTAHLDERTREGALLEAETRAFGADDAKRSRALDEEYQ